MATTSKTVKKPVQVNPCAGAKKTLQGVCLRPHLIFAGNCEAAFKLYQKVFGGEFCFLILFKDVPPSERKPDPKLRNKIYHMELSGGTMPLLGADACPDRPLLTVGNNVTLSIEASSAAEAKRMFKALSAKGKVHTPLAPCWAELFGETTDRFGIRWFVHFTGG